MDENQPPAALVPAAPAGAIAAAPGPATDAPMDAPTLAVAGEFQRAYDFFNQALFGGRLPPSVVITMQRRPRSAGYFVPDRFARVDDDGETRHEIALNPGLFRQRPAMETLAILVREMVNLWQHCHGTPSRPGYFNQEWTAQMEVVGLPTNGPGQKVEHAVAPRGPFERAADAFLAEGGGFSLGDLWTDVEEGEAAGGQHGAGRARGRRGRAAKAASKTAFRCPTCGLKVWGRASAYLDCRGHEGTGPHPPAPMATEG